MDLSLSLAYEKKNIYTNLKVREGAVSFWNCFDVEILDVTYIHIPGSASCTLSLWGKATARTTWPPHSAALLS